MSHMNELYNLNLTAVQIEKMVAESPYKSLRSTLFSSIAMYFLAGIFIWMLVKIRKGDGNLKQYLSIMAYAQIPIVLSYLIAPLDKEQKKEFKIGETRQCTMTFSNRTKSLLCSSFISSDFCSNIYGTNHDYLSLSALNMLSSRYFNQLEEEYASDVVVISDNLAEKLFFSMDCIGRSIDLYNGNWG